jgi:threonine aldolase
MDGVNAAEDLNSLRQTCTQFLNAHGRGRAADLLATIPGDAEPDRYGDGGAVTALERHVADLLGKQAAVFMPSGTMAQQIALRVHADRRGRRTVAFHPTCHIDLHESRAYERLHHLIGHPLGDPAAVLTTADLAPVTEPLAALVLELPLREIGGQQPPLAEVRALADRAHARGTAVHLDGARIWESAAGYGVTPAVVAAPFDTVYVSFYKAIGALPGCCLAGPADVIGEAREWRRRHGGTLFALWPNAASARTCLARRLPLMQEYLRHARAIADAIRDLPGVRIIPDPPQVSMMHLLLATTRERFLATAREFVTGQSLWTWPQANATIDPGTVEVEFTVGDATLAFTPERVRDILSAFVAA